MSLSEPAETSVIRIAGSDLTNAERSIIRKYISAYRAKDNSVDSVLNGDMGFILLSLADRKMLKEFQDRLSMAVICSGFVNLFGPADRNIVMAFEPEYTVMPASKEWFDLILDVFPESEYSTRFSFTSAQLNLHVLEKLAHSGEEFEFLKADREIMQHYAEKGLLDISSFKSMEHFLDNALVYTAFFNNSFFKEKACFSEHCAGVCWSCMINPGNMELSIHVDSRARKRSVATRLCALFLLEALKRNIRVNWDAANSASKGLAKKLGYKCIGSYRVLVVK